MFTTGSKLLIAASTLSIVAAFIYGISQDDAAQGVIGLVSVATVFVFLTSMNLWVRDSNVSAMDTAGIEQCSAASRPPARSMWPLVAALGAALIPVGLVVGRGITWMAVIVLAIATVEWMVLSWSERASGDAAYNTSIRRRILHPLELPVLGALGVGAIIFSFSRIMLWLSGNEPAIIFGALAAAVLLFGSLIAAKRTVARSLVVVLCTLGGVAVVGAGVATAIDGPHHIEKHELPSYEEGTCGEQETEADHKSSRSLYAKANLSATIILENGQLRAEQIGVAGSTDTVTLPRSHDAFILFKNLDDHHHRLLAYLGTETLDAGSDTERKVERAVCTQAVGEDGVQFFVVKPTLPSASAGDEPFTFTVPGVDSEITIEVP